MDIGMKAPCSNILGFDARIMDRAYPNWWTAKRKAEWLIRPDIQFPLSVDDELWPSIIDSNYVRRHGGFVGIHQNLWLDLAKLIQYVNSIDQCRHFGLIAVTGRSYIHVDISKCEMRHSEPTGAESITIKCRLVAFGL